jgi:broad-specificity NMP kinase
MAGDHSGDRLIEIAGPAGCGKTSLVEALAARCSVHLGVASCDLSCLPLALRLIPLLPAGYVWDGLRHHRMPRETMRSMVYLEWWLLQRSRRGLRDGSPVLYDHGPFFRLATLEAFGPPAGPGFRGWWDSMRDSWSEKLTRVIWLDAPDSVLLERIRRRARVHVCKEMSDEQAKAWLGRYRDAFEASLATLREHRPTDVIEFDTSTRNPNEIADALIELMEPQRE